MLYIHRHGRTFAMLAGMLGLGAGSLCNAANSFTPGDIVVYRVGDGSTALSKAAAPVFIDEYAPNGTLVQTIPLPTADSGATHALSASGSAVEGFVNLSGNGNYLLLTGYDAAPGTAAIAKTDSVTVPRIVARIDASGHIDTSTALTDVASANNIRGAHSPDGQNLWISSDLGINYATLGSTTSTNIFSSATRNVSITGGQLYAGTTTTTLPTIVSQIGTGLPTSAGATASAVTGLPAPTSSNSTNQFVFMHLGASGTGPDTLYVADDTGSALTKYSLVSGSWIATGKVGAGADDYTGLTAVQNGSSVTLYATLQRGASADELVSVVDSSGFDGSLTGATVSVLATATDAVNYGFLGVSTVPVAAPEPGCVGLLGIAVGAGLLRRRKAVRSTRM